VQVNGADLARTSGFTGFRRVLLDGPSGGSGVPFAWSVARTVRGSVPEVFVAGGLTAANVAEAIREADPYGVDVASGIEGPDGFKDADRVRAFVRAARGAR
jgi:phosphoribosylanthranilate isomerase